MKTHSLLERADRRTGSSGEEIKLRGLLRKKNLGKPREIEKGTKFGKVRQKVVAVLGIARRLSDNCGTLPGKSGIMYTSK